MKNIKIFTLLTLGFILSLSACKKDPVDPPTTNETSTFSIKAEHFWGPSGTTTVFELNKWLVHPKTKDSLKFDMFKYYITNIQLKKSGGSWWTDEESYYIMDLDKMNGNVITINNVPTGTYTELKYILGVDSARNNSGAQTGALSATNGMFWSWNTGYIFVKAEGTSPQSNDGTFAFHLGGFKGENNIVTPKQTGFNGETLEIAVNTNPIIHLNARPSMLWHAGKKVSEVSRIMMPSPTAKAMADEYFGSYIFDHIHR